MEKIKEIIKNSWERLEHLDALSERIENQLLAGDPSYIKKVMTTEVVEYLIKKDMKS